MMAMVSSSSLLPLLETLEDSTAGQPEQTDAYLTIANRLSGEEGRQFLPTVEKHFSRLGKTILTHITTPNAELSQAALQALGFCVYHGHIISGIPENFVAEILSTLCSLVMKTTDKNTCTRALWVISKQSFPSEVVSKNVSSILSALEYVWTREDIQSVVMEHEALNVIIRMVEQAPAQMRDSAVRWTKLVIPLVVHSASKVRLRAAATVEMGLPLLLEKQREVVAVIEPIMSSKLIPELQKLFMTKNEANVLKLWPLFVKLLGKLLHRGGPFINSLLHLEELGFRNSSPNIKKIAFLAWKSLIDNFALNPDILCSAKRMKLLMQPLTSINVRTEALLLTKVEVWWHLVVRLGPNLGPSFEQVSVPLLHCAIGSDSLTVPCTPARGASQNGGVSPATPKTGTPGFSSMATTPRVNLNTSAKASSNVFHSIQLLGLEMLLHYFIGPDVDATAGSNKVVLILDPLTHPLLSGVSSFTKHATVLISYVRDGFIAVGKEAPENLLLLLWKTLVSYVSSTIESAGNKKDRQGGEVLTLMLQALQSIVSSEALPADKLLVLFQLTVKGIPQKVLGSASYQVGKMDVLNGTPALFLILLFYSSNMLSAYVQDERFFQCLQTLVGCGLSGPTSSLAFGEAVLGALGRSAGSLENKEQLWRMWSMVVSPLTETITQTNEVNQGDALEHNFRAVYSALMFPFTYLLPGTALQQMNQKSMLTTWSKLYKVFARCAALVVTAEENICCEELCAKMAAALDRETLMVPATLDAVTSMLQVMVECVDFSPYTPQFQQKMKSPHTPLNWARKKNKVLGNLSSFQALLLQSLEAFLDLEDSSEATGLALASMLSTLFFSLALATAIQQTLASLIQPLTLFYKQAAIEQPKFSSQLLAKLEKLLADMLGCLQTRSTLAYDDDLLALLSPLFCVLFPHKSKPLRILVAQFWNATFANVVSLTYPDELRPVLSEVKQKTPIILPGFEVVSGPDELSGQYSIESSQLETKLSGVAVSSTGKRESLLGKGAGFKNGNSKLVSTKLDFGSPKPPNRVVLEEEASIDFVFIPPESKERVLTEHQKEVKRTKRVDIPAMYNNLDASQDAMVFTESQEDSLDKMPAEEAAQEASSQVHQEDIKIEGGPEILTKETQDYARPNTMENIATEPRNDMPEEMVLEPTDVSTEDAKSDFGTEDLDSVPTEITSPNLSGSSDLISGTPQKPNSRRQSFITLEKYSDGKPASPINVTKFTGPLTKPSSSQDPTTTTSPLSQTSRAATAQASESLEMVEGNPVTEASQQAKADSYEESKEVAVRIEKTEIIPSEGTEGDNDVIPDTQTNLEDQMGTESAPTAEKAEPQSQGEELEETLRDSDCSQTECSPCQPRRSGRHRIRPQLPGVDPAELEEKYGQKKKRQSDEAKKVNSPKENLLDKQAEGRLTRRNKQAAEVEVSARDKLRSKAQNDKNGLSQTSSQIRVHRKTNLYGSSEDLLGNEHKRKWTVVNKMSQADSQSETQSDDNESQVELNQQSKLKTGGGKRKGRPPNERKALSQIDLEEATQSPSKRQSRGRPSRKRKELSNSVSDLDEQTEKDEFEPYQSDSQQNTPSLKTDSLFQGRMRRRSKLANEPEELTEDKHKAKDGKNDKLSQDDSQNLTPSASGSQSQGRSKRRSKALSEAAENSAEKETKTESEASISDVSKTEGRLGGRLRKSKVEGESINTPSLTPESSQSLDIAESSQGRGRYSRLRSSQALLANMETSESESSENREGSPLPKRRGRKPKLASPSPLTFRSGEHKVDQKVAQNNSEVSQNAVPQSSTPIETKTPAESLSSHDSQVSGLAQVTQNVKEQNEEKSHIEVDINDIALKPVVGKANTLSTQPSEPEELKGKNCRISTRKRRRGKRQSKVELDSDSSFSQEQVIMGSAEPESIDFDVTKAEQHKEELSSEMLVPSAEGNSISDNNVSVEPMNVFSSPEASGSSANLLTPSGKRAEQLSLQVSESSEEKVLEVEQVVGGVSEKQVTVADSDYPEPSSVQLEEKIEKAIVTTTGQDQQACQNPIDELAEAEKHMNSVTEGPPEFQHIMTSTPEREVQGDDQDSEPVQERPEEDSAPDLECDDEPETQVDNRERDVDCMDLEVPLASVGCASVSSDMPSKDLGQDSPAKQKGLEAVMEPEVGQSPSSGRTRGTWSPSASPSTSILKKGQKRAVEEETPSPLIKSRRVSFANPIQHQELADDIDRRSPVIRSSSPKRSKALSGIQQPKYVSTPTKGLLILSPRNLHSPGYKSSKKCLISEMSLEPRPIPRDCVYPALVGCTMPVEAVLPQITSNMWPRGLGQLMRAKNIKTVGDLSASTPSEIKNLPIRTPKISNVKKALKTYEQQRKGRVGDELKSFDEMEKMTSELEETSAPQNQEEDKSAGEPLATELVDEPMLAEQKPEAEASVGPPPEGQLTEPIPGEQLHREGLLLDVEVLSSRMTPAELGRTAPQQLLQLHHRLGDLMRSVVLELQTRLCQQDAKP
ncbi:telomere-associated protein RIF1 [Lampris incognitus]|uniref:telomere-associated protein RIF1 n=1 Tax=Lampris incognitus TaxID=2546036 RepID=UPI0024B5329A|nr:telomere-associated protein RIF1 [Lampris incognitus]